MEILTNYGSWKIQITLLSTFFRSFFAQHFTQNKQICGCDDLMQNLLS